MDAGILDWNALTLFCYICARMTGFVAFSPIFGRSGIPAVARVGMILLFSYTAQAACTYTVPLPGTVEEALFRMLAELGVGLALNLVIRFFLFIPEQAGEQIDTQMGMSMARSYDPSFQNSSTINASLLSQMMLILFFLGDGHVTLLRMMLTSGDVVPFGSAALGQHVADRALALFTECILLSVKMCLPILASELLGQVGMGILMKVIPQINVFAINIELKVVIGFAMLSLMMAAIGDFMLETESYMLVQLKGLLALAGG